MTLKLEGIKQNFGESRVFNGLHFEVASNSTTLLIGHNGSGKSTLLRILAGLQTPDSGNIGGLPARIGYLGHQLMLYDSLTPREHLEFEFATQANKNLTSNQIKITTLERWGILPYADRRVGVLSKGQQMRTALLCTLANDPKLILLDEPNSWLDREGLQILIEELKLHLNKNCSIVIATHAPESFKHLSPIEFQMPALHPSNNTTETEVHHG